MRSKEKESWRRMVEEVVLASQGAKNNLLSDAVGLLA